MEKGQPTSKVIRFGQWSFDTELGELSSGQKSIRLEPQVAKVLSYFYNQQDKLITKDELIHDLWENRVVSDHAITRCISNIRQILSPNDRNAIIKTMSRRGFIASFPEPIKATKTKAKNDLVLEHDANKNSYDVKNPKPSTRMKKGFLGAIVVLFAVILISIVIPPQTNSESQLSNTVPIIAILPFSADSFEDEKAIITQGLHSELLTQLSKIRNIRVISNATVQDYVNAPQNYANIGKDLNANYILGGNIQFVNNTIRINVSLTDVSTSQYLWSDTYQIHYTVKEIFQIYGEIAKAISTEINIELSSIDSQKVSNIPTDNMAAYRIYRKAMDAYETRKISSSSPELMEALETVVALDPSFTRAWADIASFASLRNFTMERQEQIEKAENAIATLQRLAPNSADYLYAKASYLYYVMKDLDTAYTIIQYVVINNPSNTRALLMKSYIERRLGYRDKRVQTLKVIHQLEPTNTLITLPYFSALRIAEKYDELEHELQSYKGPRHERIEKLKHMFAFKQHKDLAKLLKNTQEECIFSTDKSCAWVALIANREYEKALNSLSETDLSVDISEYGLDEVNKLFTFLLIEDEALGDEYQQHWRRYFSQNNNANEIYQELKRSFRFGIIESLLLANLGENQTAIKHIFKYLKKTPVDLAKQSYWQIISCRAFAIMNAHAEAMHCLKEAIRHSLHAMKFFEHHLPFYDGMRQMPEFQAWVIKMENG